MGGSRRRRWWWPGFCSRRPAAAPFTWAGLITPCRVGLRPAIWLRSPPHHLQHRSRAVLQAACRPWTRPPKASPNFFSAPCRLGTRLVWWDSRFNNRSLALSLLVQALRRVPRLAVCFAALCEVPRRVLRVWLPLLPVSPSRPIHTIYLIIAIPHLFHPPVSLRRPLPRFLLFFHIHLVIYLRFAG